MGRLSYIIVGSGYRAEYYARIARTYPQQFHALFLCRSEEKAARIQEKTGIQATTSIEVCEQFGADFAVIAVNKENIADVCEEWVDRGYPGPSEGLAAGIIPRYAAGRICDCNNAVRYAGIPGRRQRNLSAARGIGRCLFLDSDE